jgi:hypothetical protein
MIPESENRFSDKVMPQRNGVRTIYDERIVSITPWR